MDLSPLLMTSGHLLALLAYLALTGLVVVSRRRSPHRIPILLAALGTSLWAAGIFASTFVVPAGVVLVPLELLRTAGWVFLLIHLLSATTTQRSDARLTLSRITIGLPVIAIAAMAVGGAAWPNLISDRVSLYLSAASIIVMTLGGLTVLEALLRQLGQRGSSAARYLLIGAGSLFAFDFFLYATALLLGRIDWSILEARGFATALSAPLFAVALAREREWMVDIHVTRRVVTSAVVVVGGGCYLLAMAATGFAVRELNVAWGPTLHILFLAAAIVLLALMVSSGWARSRLQNFVSRNFFSNKYDYRAEWQNFSRAVAEGHLRLENRILNAVLATFGCSAGALWLKSEHAEDLVLAASTSLEMPSSTVTLEEALADSWDAHAPKLLKGPERTTLSLVAGLEAPWVAIPLRHRGELLGVIVMAEPASQRDLGTEDRELMQALALQAAGHLAEERLSAVVTRTRRFESYARRASYATHDLKNLANQLSLALQNWKRLEDNPEFRAEMPQVLGHAVDRIKRLLESLKTQGSSDQQTTATFSLNACVEGVLPLWRARLESLEVELDRNDALLFGHRDQFESVVDQLLANACEACGPRGKVKVTSQVERDLVSVSIIDTGPGIARDVIASSQSGSVVDSKSGFGIGLFQVRDYLRQFDGRLELSAEDGAGTMARIVLSRSAAQADLATATMGPER